MTNLIPLSAREVLFSPAPGHGAWLRPRVGANDHSSAVVRKQQHCPGHLASLITSLLLFVVAALPVRAQIIETVAGGGVGDGGPATAAMLNFPVGVALDRFGNLYIADASNSRIRKVAAATGVVTTVAGTGGVGYNGDNIAATSAMLSLPRRVVFDSASNFYFADTGNHRIRKVSLASGLISTVAGTGVDGYNGDGIVASSAMLSSPGSVAIDSAGNLYVSEFYRPRIRKINAATGLISTVAGTGVNGYNGDNILAINATLKGPADIAFDSSGNLHFGDGNNNRVRKVTTATGIITTVAGTGALGFNGDNVLATSATLGGPGSIAFDSAGDLYIADVGNSRIRKVVTATGIIYTVAGIGSNGYNGDNIAAANANIYSPIGIAFDASDNLYIADAGNYRIRKVTAASGMITTVAGNGFVNGYNGDNIAATSATLNRPAAVAVDRSGNLYIADLENQRVRKVTATTGVITTVADTGSIAYRFDNPGHVAVDSTGNLYIAYLGRNLVRKVSKDATIATTVVGTDGIVALGIAVDTAGNLYIGSSHRILKVAVATGAITTVAGTGSPGYSGDNIAATAAQLNGPTAIAVDAADNLYIADTSNGRVRKVTFATGIITTVAGNGLNDARVDNIAATSAAIFPSGVGVDIAGNLYILDFLSIRKVVAATGIITTIAGTGFLGYNGDNIAATEAHLNRPRGIAVDMTGSLYIADSDNNRIRKVPFASSAALSANYQGLWWNAPAGSESGWGINFAHQGNDLFATWFTYDATGRALWLSMTANKFGTDYIGTLFQTRGPAFSAVPFSPAAVTRTPVGSGTLTFADANNGRFAYIFNGTTQSKEIVRQVFGPLPTCTFGGQPNPDLATNYQDLWWAAPGGIESGWGVNFTHQGDTIFATWFTYDADGTPLWLSATATKSGSGIYAGALYRTTGPAFNAVPFPPASVVRAVVGTLALTFANGNSGSFAYTLNGVAQSKSITRQVFNAPGTVCQ